MNYPGNIEQLILTLPSFFHVHASNTEFREVSVAMARQEAERLFSSSSEIAKEFKPFGKLIFPYHQMGAVDSLNLFDFDELVIFSFYWANRNRYKRVADIGANIGLHSIILEKCGFEVRSYEPDPQHFDILQKNLKLNQCLRTETFNSAVSTKSGEVEFIRVLGNTTGSYIAGSKPSPTGETERFTVKTEPIQPIIDWADLLKVDVEGHEKDILLATSKKDWLTTDAIVETGNERNAESIFSYFNKIEVNLFAQKINWQLVEKLEQMPTSYRDGSLFITCKDEMPWQ